MREYKPQRDFKAGQRVKIYNGGKLEGSAIILKAIPGQDNYYRVHFDEDAEGEDINRFVEPEWQRPGFKPGRAS